MEKEHSKKAKKPLFSLFEIDYLISLHSDEEYYLAYKWGIDNFTSELVLYILEISDGFPMVITEIRGTNSLELINYLNEVMIEFYSEDDDEDDEVTFVFNYNLN